MILNIGKFIGFIFIALWIIFQCYANFTCKDFKWGIIKISSGSNLSS